MRGGLCRAIEGQRNLEAREGRELRLKILDPISHDFAISHFF